MIVEFQELELGGVAGYTIHRTVYLIEGFAVVVNNA